MDKVRYNLNRKAARVRLFEVGRVFHRDGNVTDGGLTVAGYHQPMVAAGIAYGPAFDEQWGIATRPVDFFDVKGDVESLFAPASGAFRAGGASRAASGPRRSRDRGRQAGWRGGRAAPTLAPGIRADASARGLRAGP